MGGDAGDVVKGALVGAAIVTGVGIAIGTVAFTGAAVASAFTTAFVTQAALGAVATAMSPKPEQYTSAAELRGRTIMSKQAIASREVVYGRVKKSGVITFLETTNDNEDLHLCLALAGHEISAIEQVFMNDQLVRGAEGVGFSDGVEVAPTFDTDPSYKDKTVDEVTKQILRMTPHNGTSGQTADSNLVARTSAPNTFRNQGIAYLYAKLEYDQDVYANGLPNISVLMAGKKVYDPRSETTAFSDNAALCIRDYISNSTYGLGATDAEIDDDSFIAAANICDEDVSVLGGGTEKRYTINGIIDTGKQPREILNDLLTSCGGTIYYSNGKWKLKVGAYVTPTDTITNDDLRGSIKIQTRNSGQNQFNAVKGIFVSPENNWQPTDFPEVTSSTFESEDGGERNYVDVTLPYTTSVSTAQRISKQMLYRNREQIVVTLPCKLTAFKYEVGDTVQVTNERFGWTNKVFEVISWSFAFEGEQLGVDLVLKETSSGIYAWDETVDEKSFTFNNTTLPNAFVVNAPGVTVSDELRALNEEAISVLIVDVSSSDTFINSFEVQARKSGQSTYINLGRASGNRFELLNVEDGVVYEVRARTVNTFGVRSAFTNASHQVVGKTAPPSDVTGLAGNLIGNQYLLTWNPVSDLDLSYYRIRYAESTTAEYRESISLVPKVSRPGTSVFVPARNGKYFVKAVDKLGLASNTAATIVLDSNIEGLNNLNVVETLSEHPDFNGTFDDVVEIDEDDRLVLDTSINFEDVTGDFDDAEGLFDAGGGNVDASGFYYFGNSSDLGAVYLAHVTARIKHIRVDYIDLFDSVQGLFDDRQGDFDGDPNAFDDTNAELQIRTTQDDPTGTPTWSAWQPFQVGDYRFWGAEFRVKMTTTDPDATPAVSELSVTIDMPDRVESANDLVTSSGVKVVTFPTAFHTTPAIGIGAQDMQTGDYYEITAKSRTGFTITFKQSSGSVVSTERTFDYVAKGYGYEVT